MFNNYKKHHPNYEPFFKENQFGIKIMMDSILCAFKKYEAITNGALCRLEAYDN